MNPIAEELLQLASWDRLRTLTGDASDIPAALSDLAAADDEASANLAYWRLDNRIVVQGQLFPAALAAVPVLLALLAGNLSHWSRLRTVDLLLQIGGGSTDSSETEYGRDLGREARDVLRDAMWVFYGLALDSDARISEAAIELATTVDLDRTRRDSILTVLARSETSVSNFAKELLVEYG